MKFVADVNINITPNVINLLRKSGHDVLDIKKQDPRTSDVNIIKLASKEKRIILTHDKDFLVLTHFPKYQVGTILIRLKKQTASHHWEKLQDLLNKRSEYELKKSLTLLTEESVDSHPYLAPDEKIRQAVVPLVTESLGLYSYGVLGQKGFFDNFKVCFDKLNQKIEITPKKIN